MDRLPFVVDYILEKISKKKGILGVLFLHREVYFRVGLLNKGGFSFGVCVGACVGNNLSGAWLAREGIWSVKTCWGPSL